MKAAAQLRLEMLKWYCAEGSGHAEERPCKTYGFMTGSWLKAGASYPPRRSTQQPTRLLSRLGARLSPPGDSLEIAWR